MLWTAVGLLTAPCHPHVEPDGLSRMEGIGGKAGWSWIVSPPFFFPSRPLAVKKPGKLSKPVPFFIPQFIIEGLLSFVIGVASIWMVQDWPEDAKFITPLERAMVLQRLKDDT